MHFLFPEDPRGHRIPQDFFVEQADALADAGFTYSLFGDDDLRTGRGLEGVPPAATVVYRGWMLDAVHYGLLTSAIKKAGGSPMTSERDYLATHHLPNWYPLIPELTPESRVYPADADLARELTALGWGEFFVKDYVKSLKTSVGSLVRDPSEIGRVVSGLREYRGEIEGGICVRRVEDFVAETERRFFVVNGRAYAAHAADPIPEAVRVCAGRISSDFFSVDIVQRTDAVTRVVEVGDGQVSDLVGWSAQAFAAMWSDAVGV